MTRRAHDDDDGLNRAIALSLADTEAESRAWAEVRARAEARSRLELDQAVAVSLHDQEVKATAGPSADGWDCKRCTLTNDADSGRCEMCGADRATPFAARDAPPAAEAEWRCGLPGCNKPRVHFDFCCEDHKQRAAARGYLAPRSVGVERCFVGATGDYSCELLTNRHPDRARVVEHFRMAWRKPSAVPRVERVYAVRPSPQLVERYERYRAAVGNERERYHGTGALCSFAIDDNRAPCTSPQCALCSILASGFLLAHSGTGPNAGRANLGTASGLRFGRGLYFSSTSGKSNDYAHGSERQRRGRSWRTLFVAKVAAGAAYKTDEASLDVSRPPEGYDSVVGEVGANLNYDELVVYQEAAALPEFLIVVSFDQ
jgi:hypothetical protein